MAIFISCMCLIFGIGKVNHHTKGQWFKIFLQMIRETWMKINVVLLYELYECGINVGAASSKGHGTATGLGSIRRILLYSPFKSETKQIACL
jgi:hypothetical protein